MRSLPLFKAMDYKTQGENGPRDMLQHQPDWQRKNIKNKVR